MDESLADLRRAERCGARLVTPEDDEWPALPLHALVLATAAEPEDPKHQSARTVAPVPPLALWVRGPGRLDELADRSVAIVGSRASTAYGEHVAGEFGYQLAERGWTVVSGGAYGIDAAAHRGALAAEGPTIAVLACGVDRPYPAGNGALLHRIAESGLVVSEWPPGAAPHQHRFLVRNRLIAGLTRGTVVVEAAARSGAVATANRARKLGKQVMVVPGPVTSAMSVGCHELLREQAPRRARRSGWSPRPRTCSRRSAASAPTSPTTRPAVRSARRAQRRRRPGARRVPGARRCRAPSGWRPSPAATSSTCCGCCRPWSWPTWSSGPARAGGWRRGRRLAHDDRDEWLGAGLGGLAVPASSGNGRSCGLLRAV